MGENIKNISKGVGIALISTMILLLIFAIVLTYTNISENTIAPVIIVVTAISILLRKFNRKHENKKEWNIKWLNYRWMLCIVTLYYFKFAELEIWFELAKYYNDSSTELYLVY